MLKQYCIAITTLLMLAFSVKATETQILYIYHDKPPYVIDLESQKGLYFDLAKLINAVQKDVRVEVRFVPRKRLDKQLERQTFQGFILGVNPAWFDDRKKQKYLWSSPLMYDTDEFVSHIDQPFEYYHPSSLYGNQVGAIAGYYYRHLDQGMEQSNIQRVNVNSEEALLEIVLKKRVSIAIVSRSTTEYLIAKNGWKRVFHFSQNPHETYFRAILAPKSSVSDFEALQLVLDSKPFKKQLVKLLKSYHLVY
ncbi:transporter substrate-binding domain-containing protein [Pseudoalteromonas sp. S4498]|uniref:substrate-binding periplasmic protein n=1 Tax=Pseudoalteromonas galatheae TaxID=579562 RepID=UPI001109E9A2|nr:transporter substrate-binding domain-containing protein [Pseudoalteromonas galatheae]NKC18368.1 transporter substrate-binding domain-containing protein [Pseudoalteromonas galatheae]